MTVPAADDAAVRGAGAGPRASVIIPAHDEERLIGPALRALLADAAPDELEVVVACNGCTDRTEDRAREVAAELGYPVTVLSSPVPSKAAAIRAAERVVRAFPRVYLDADVECTTATVRALVTAVEDGAALAVPTRELDLSASAPLARAYYSGWHSLPWVQAQLAGRGVYAVSAGTRALFGEFPDVAADDRYVTTLVPRERAVVVPEAVPVVPPTRLRQAVRVRRRIYAANVVATAPAHDRSRGDRLRTVARMVRERPALLPELAVFAGASAVAKALAVRDVRRGSIAWSRDHTSRSR